MKRHDISSLDMLRAALQGRLEEDDLIEGDMSQKLKLRSWPHQSFRLAVRSAFNVFIVSLSN